MPLPLPYSVYKINGVYSIDQKSLPVYRLMARFSDGNDCRSFAESKAAQSRSDEFILELKDREIITSHRGRK